MKRTHFTRHHQKHTESFSNTYADQFTVKDGTLYLENNEREKILKEAGLLPSESTDEEEQEDEMKKLMEEDGSFRDVKVLLDKDGVNDLNDELKE